MIWCIFLTATILAVYWSAFLTTDHEVPGSIPGSTMGILLYQGKIPTVETGIEPGTSPIVVRNAAHYTTTLVIYIYVYIIQCFFSWGTQGYAYP
jgi:hypothetical protein